VRRSEPTRRSCSGWRGALRTAAVCIWPSDEYDGRSGTAGWGGQFPRPFESRGAGAFVFRRCHIPALINNETRNDAEKREDREGGRVRTLRVQVGELLPSGHDQGMGVIAGRSRFFPHYYFHRRARVNSSGLCFAPGLVAGWYRKEQRSSEADGPRAGRCSPGATCAVFPPCLRRAHAALAYVDLSAIPTLCLGLWVS